MLSGLLRYLVKHPEQEKLFADAFIEEIRTNPRIDALVTLIAMLGKNAYNIEGKRFFTDELVTEMANQIALHPERLEEYSVLWFDRIYPRKQLPYIDGLVYKAYGIHLLAVSDRWCSV